MPDDREQVIRKRAYEIWKQQGCPAGHSLDHWLQADAEMANDEALGIRHEGKLEPPLPRGPQAIKDVLVFLGTRAAADSCLRIAADLARKHRAYLTAVYLPSEVESEFGQNYGPGAIGIGIAGLSLARVGEGSGVDPNPDRAQGQPQHVAAEIAERHFRETLQLNGIAGEWYISAPGEVSELIALATAADVVIIGQHQAETQAGGKFLPREIVVACGRPLVVVPYAGNFASLGKRVLIAWDGTPEATRAVHDALPLIADAETVKVISVASRESGIERQHPSLARIVRHLERHGLPAAGTDDVQAGIRVSDVLLSRANDLAADLIVAGAYHHSRFREAVLGGVSRELLEHMTVPVLMSH